MAAVFALAVCGLVLARVARWRGAWRWIGGGFLAMLLAAQLLPAAHPFRVEAAAWGRTLFWLAVAAAPIGAYAAWVRALRRRTGVDAPPPPAPAGPRGLVLFPSDAALATETAGALLAAAPGARTTLGWRGEDGALEGVLRLRLAGDLAEAELFRAPDPEVAAVLVEAAEREAAAGGAARIGVLVAPWQSETPFLAAGYAPEGAAGGRRWLEKRL